MTKLIFVDTETTGLDLYRHKIWEVGAIVRDNDVDTEYHWFLNINISDADPIALDIGKFWQRHPSALWKLSENPKKEGLTAAVESITNNSKFAHEFFRLSYNAHFVGAVPDFDSYRIAQIFDANGLMPKWNYHLICVENLLAGKLAIPPPWKWRETLPKIGINLDDYEQHTALGDARLARDVYDKVMTDESTKEG